MRIIDLCSQIRESTDDESILSLIDQIEDEAKKKDFKYKKIKAELKDKKRTILGLRTTNQNLREKIEKIGRWTGK